MRFALILAGGSGTRLWPMSRYHLPKQLLPLVDGKSLLELAYHRLDGLVDPQHRFVCAGERHRESVLRGLPELESGNFLGEPDSRNTLPAIAYATAIIARIDPEAVVGVFPADELIEPEDDFRRVVGAGYEIAETVRSALVTFGVTPTHPATGYGYLQLGATHEGTTRIVTQFREKPDRETAERWVAEGPSRYLWNSGMFVWKASAFSECLRRYEPECFEAIGRIAGDFGRDTLPATLYAVYPGLPKVSVEYAIMEKAARDPAVRVMAVPMNLSWADIGSWHSFARTCATDASGNAPALRKAILMDTSGTFVASSDPSHLVVVVGCRNLIVVHTPDATLVCDREMAEKVKNLPSLVADKFGDEYR